MNRAKNITGRKLEKIIKISYTQIPTKHHTDCRPPNTVNSNSLLHIISIYRLKIAVNKQWIL